MDTIHYEFESRQNSMLNNEELKKQIIRGKMA